MLVLFLSAERFAFADQACRVIGPRLVFGGEFIVTVMLGLDRFGEILRFYVTQVIFTERSSEFTSADIQSFKHLGREHVGHWLSSDLRTDVARAFLANFTVERGKARQCASGDCAEPTARDFTDALHRARFKEF